MTIKGILESGVYVHCETLHQAEHLLNMMEDIGYAWPDNVKPSVESYYSCLYRENSAYGLRKYGQNWVIDIASVRSVENCISGKTCMEYADFICETTETMAVKTPFGDLVAEKSTDPDYPGIFLSLRRPDGIMIDLAGIEMNNGSLHGLIWGDTKQENYTHKVVWRPEDLS